LGLIVLASVVTFALACAGAEEPPRAVIPKFDANFDLVTPEISNSFTELPGVQNYTLGDATSTTDTSASGNSGTGLLVSPSRSFTSDQFMIMRTEVTVLMYVDFLNSPVPEADEDSGGSSTSGSSEGRKENYHAQMLQDSLAGIFRTDDTGGIVGSNTGGSGLEDEGEDGGGIDRQKTFIDPFFSGMGRLKRQQASGGGGEEVVIYNTSPGREKYPITFVSKTDTISFAQWLGPQYRLPTEDEWEYAAKGLPIPLKDENGNVLKDENGNVLFARDENGNLLLAQFPTDPFDSNPMLIFSDDYASAIRPDIPEGIQAFMYDLHQKVNYQGEFAKPLFPTMVKSYGANSFGLYDMAGNVAELVVKDKFDFPILEEPPFVYIKGGSWRSKNLQELVTSSFFGPFKIDTIFMDVGFRLVFDIANFASVHDFGVEATQ